MNRLEKTLLVLATVVGVGIWNFSSHIPNKICGVKSSQTSEITTRCNVISKNGKIEIKTSNKHYKLAYWQLVDGWQLDSVSSRNNNVEIAFPNAIKREKEGKTCFFMAIIQDEEFTTDQVCY